MLGISCVICCYNSADRLPKTLGHLAIQQIRKEFPWEVIIVNNASQDNTVQVATDCWLKAGEPAPIRIINEGQLGIGHARYRGIAEANYELIGFIDDDNWVTDNWVQIAYDFMSDHPEVGACGGLNEVVTTDDLPLWFKQFQRSYAVGPQSEEPGDVTELRGVLWSAGMILRKSAIQQLFKEGFQPIVVGAKGEKILMRGEDYELCLALRLNGWRLWYEPHLRLKHFMPVSRLEWKYLRQLLRGVGASSIGLDPYYFINNKYIVAQNNLNNGKLKRHIPEWLRQAYQSLKLLLSHYNKLFLSYFLSLEGDPEVILIERTMGRLWALIMKRQEYDQNLYKVRSASWLKVQKNVVKSR